MELLSQLGIGRRGVRLDSIRRYGHVALPFVLIALGLYILSGARALL